MRIVATILIVYALCTVAYAEQPSTELTNAQNMYKELLQKIDTKFRPPPEGMYGKYPDALDALKSQLQSKADLDGILAVTKEIDRFKLAQNIPDDAIVQTPPELRNLQQKYAEIPLRIENQKKAEVADLTKRYLDRLKQIQDIYTRAGNLDKALEVKSEIDSLLSNIEPIQLEKPQTQPITPYNNHPASNNVGGNLLGESKDITQEAEISVSDFHPLCPANNVVDGNQDSKWRSDKRGSTSAWFQLTWKSPRTLTGITLRDSKHPTEWTPEMALEFSDGTRIEIKDVPRGSDAEKVINFEKPIKATWLKITPIRLSRGYYFGLSEVKVMGK